MPTVIWVGRRSLILTVVSSGSRAGMFGSFAKAVGRVSGPSAQNGSIRLGGVRQFVEQAGNIAADRRQLGKLLGHRRHALLKFALGVDEDIDAGGKVAVLVGFEKLDLGDKPVAQFLHLRDEIGDAAVPGFERTK